MHSKTLPSGCDQQGRHNTRRERWIEQEWRETMLVPRREPVPEPEPEQPYSIGDAVMAAAILAAIAAVLSYGPWL
jgi:hypothetical protein